MSYEIDNQKNDNIDNLCYTYFNYTKEIPIGVKNNIKLTCQNLKTPHKSKIKIRQAIVYGLCIIFLTSGIVSAKDIKNFVTNVFFGNSKGIQNAIDNNYILNSNMSYIESNNVNLKISEIIMDNSILGINFSILLDENLSENNTDISLKSILISDENNNILYCNSQSIFDEYSSTYNLNYTFNNFNSNYINSGENHYSTIEKKEDNYEVNCTYNFYSNGYPKSQKLYITINNLNVNNKELDCNWKIEIDIPEKFCNREVSLYRPEKNNSKKIIIKSVSVQDTTTTVQLDFKLKSDYENSYYKNLANKLREEGKTSQEITDIINTDRKNNNNTENISSFNLFQDIYIENSDNEIFYQDLNLIEGNTMKINKETLLGTATFSFGLTKYDMTNNLYLHFIYDDEEFFIELIKDT